MKVEKIEITELPRSPDDRRKTVALFSSKHTIFKADRRKKQRRKKVSN